MRNISAVVTLQYLASQRGVIGYWYIPIFIIHHKQHKTQIYISKRGEFSADFKHSTEMDVGMLS